ncbi:hypothetical protein BDZ45DRAFT_375461 [Acephala macrosclerotiorum]|nr:hypothetical protein BDZ45DRAFT_375461 [Acephala macrosclerotiorum]
MNLPIATLPGFPFFYAIPIDGQIREIPNQPQIWDAELDGFAEDENDNTLLQLHPPPYSKPPPKQPQQAASGQLPSVQEVDETIINTGPIYRGPIVPDEPVILRKVRSNTESMPTSRTKTFRRKIRYPSLPIGRWAQPSSSNDEPPKDINDFGRTVPQTSEIIHKRKLRWPSLSTRSSWASFRPPVSSPLTAAVAASKSMVSMDLPQTIEMPHELDAIRPVSPISPFGELDSTPISELSSENPSALPTPQLCSEASSRTSTPPPPPTRAPPVPVFDQSPYRSWYPNDDSGELATRVTTPPPPHSDDVSPPPHSYSPSNYSPQPSTAPSFSSNSSPSIYSSNRSSGSSQWSQASSDFQGDIKETIPDLSNLPPRPMSILLMTEEEVQQAELIEDIFLMLHDLQPGYLHPAHRPQPNVVRTSMIRQYATHITNTAR